MEDKLGDKLRRRGKLPGLPQKPRSAFFLWVNAEGRDKTKVFVVAMLSYIYSWLKAENPGLSRREVSKKSGEVWNKIDSETKNRFVEEAKAEKEKYQQDYKVQFLYVMDH